MTPLFRQILTLLLLLLGLQTWLLLSHGVWGKNAHVDLLFVSLALAAIPITRRIIWSVLRRLRRPSLRIRLLTTLLITVISAIAFYIYAQNCGRDLFPTMQDEFQFLLQTRMLASGRLWMPPHPLLDFFDTFYVLIQPKYAAQSFPGAAFFFIPAIWLHLTVWKWSIVLAALSVGLIYRVVAELLDGLAGLLAAIMLAVLPLHLYLSTMVLAQIPMVILGLATLWAWLKWRQARSSRYSLLIGFLVGMMAITRPVDAVIYALPIAIAMLLDLNRHRPDAIRTVACATLAAVPWLTLQLIFNLGVTGNPLTTPFALYNQRDQPGLEYSLHSPDIIITNLATQVREKRDFYQGFILPKLAIHKPALLWDDFKSVRLPGTLEKTLPQPLLLALLPLGILGAFRRRAWIMAAPLPLFFLLYTPYPIFTLHYTEIAAPAAILTVLLAPAAFAHAFPIARSFVWTAMTIFVTGLIIVPPVTIFPLIGAIVYHSTVLKAADEQQAALTAKGEPAVILFHRDPNLSIEAEPVYNIQTAWPDDAIVIRAHDRGDENAAIYNYYRARRFYRFDESNPAAGVMFLGLGSELAKSVP